MNIQPNLLKSSYNVSCVNFQKKIEPQKGENNKDTFATKAKMKQLELHEEYARLAWDSVQDEKINIFNKYDRIKFITDKNNGFNACVYKNNSANEIIIAYRCTNNQEGVVSDIQMVKNEIPDQFDDALSLYEKVKEEYQGKKITLIGHSLGASLAQLVASKYPEVQAVTFDGYGTIPILKQYELKDNNNCINYVTKNSIVSSVSPHPGSTHTIEEIPVYNINEYTVETQKVTKNKHSVANFFNLQEAKFSKNESLENAKRIFNYYRTNGLANTLMTVFPAIEKELPKIFFKKTEC